MRIYIAGPMTGIPDHNYPAFRSAAAELTARGFDAVDPSRQGQVDGWTWQQYMRRGIADLITCDGLALLPGSHNSRGARIERRLAEDIGLEVHGLAYWLAFPAVQEAAS